MKSFYVGSILYDNDHSEMQDEYVKEYEYPTFITKMKELMNTRNHSEVMFAVLIKKNGVEQDITKTVKRVCELCH